MSLTTYQKDLTGITQTATNNAAVLAAAELNGGIIKSHDTLVKRFEELRESILVPLKEAVETDNAMFKAEEALDLAKPKVYPKGGKAKSSGKASAQDADAAPGDTVINGKGKFAGLTIAAVHALTGEQSAEYGYVDKESVGKPGSLYIQWMTTNDGNPFMQRKATAFIESLRASSDAA